MFKKSYLFESQTGMFFWPSLRSALELNESEFPDDAFFTAFLSADPTAVLHLLFPLLQPVSVVFETKARAVSLFNGVAIFRNNCK